MRTVAQILTEQRLTKGLSLEQLSKLSNIKQEHLRLIESGQHKPTMPTVFRICKALNFDPLSMADMLANDFSEYKRSYLAINRQIVVH